MRPVRRHDYSPRVEMMPLIDVVFLLLMFFIFAVAVMDLLKTTGVDILSVEGAQDVADQRVIILEIDAEGGVLIDRVPIADDELDARLRSIAKLPDPPPLVLALQEVQTQVDRGPILVRLLDRIKRAGVADVRLPKLGAEAGGSP